MLRVGDELGRYEIIAHLKSGGMATLYLGRRRIPPDNRIFAIKVVHPHFLDDEDLVAMFEDEARLSLRIQHPNVVRIEEVGEVGGVHFLAMEYIHGCSVAQLLQALIRHRRRMSPELAVYIAMQACEALDAAHSLLGDHGELLNVVHRDVSPQNILLAHTGDLRLIDFGIAKSRARMHHSSTGSSVRGKLRYMSPEHAKGHDVDQRTDIYALGIVLWEMLTMRPLFWGETDFDVLTKVQDPLVDPPSEYAPNISPALDDAVLIALSANREARPTSALEFRTLLSRAAPIAEALDDEQIAELLHAVLGEEMHRVADRMPAFVSMELRFPQADTATMPDAPSAMNDGALEVLTGPQDYDPAVIKTFVGNPGDMSGIDQLLGAASVELVAEETSTTVDALVPADIRGRTVAGAKAFGLDAEPEDPTDRFSHAAAAAIHHKLAQRTVEAAMLSSNEGDADDDLDTVTLDESVPALLGVGIDADVLELGSREIEIIDILSEHGRTDEDDDDDDDDDEDVTLVAAPNIPLDERELSGVGQAGVRSGASWRGVEPAAVAPPASALDIDSPTEAEVPMSPGDEDAPTRAEVPLPMPAAEFGVPTEAEASVPLTPPGASHSHPSTSPESPNAFDVTLGAPAVASAAQPSRKPGMHENLPDTRAARFRVGDSDPPTMVNATPPEFRFEDSNVGGEGGFEAGDRVALAAGIFLALLLLVAITLFLLI
ncbi:MAG: protein kinase [Deltaproteobacteria bacterium]|nr:protein kinase [Deltaproteobacteria bacterium]